MSKDMIHFHFQDIEIRIIDDEQGQPWFVAKDVCDALEHSNSRAAVALLDDDEKGVRKAYTLGGEQEVQVINESGLYNLIFASKKQKAKEFKKWVTSEVLPSLRKTGTYTAPASTALIPVPPAPIGANIPVIPMPTIDTTGLAREVRSWKSIAKTLGFNGNQSILFTCNAIKRRYRIDLLDIMDAPAHFVAENQTRHFSVTELAGRIGLSGIKLNKLLCDQGFQVSERDSKKNIYYVPTDRGKPFAVLTDTSKQHSNGTPIQQLRWLETLLEHVEILVKP